jgi:hypothetical protein
MIKSKIARAPRIFFGAEWPINKITNIIDITARDARSILRSGIRTGFTRPK